jgi:hypothetical protein
MFKDLNETIISYFSYKLSYKLLVVRKFLKIYCFVVGSVKRLFLHLFSGNLIN